MFLPPKLTTIVLNSLALLLLFAASSDAQQAEFNRRAAAMQEARARAQQAPPARLASRNDIGIDYSAPPSPPARVARASRQVMSGQPNSSQNRRVLSNQTQSAQGLSNTRQVANRYVPEHLRTAQLMESAIVDGGAPVVDSGQISTMPYTGDVVGGGFIDGGCDSCGDSGSYFSDCDSCCDRGGCPPGNCWITGFGQVLRNAEYFGGATSFRSALFTVPGATTGTRFDDCSHGFYGGFNLGLPLCKLSCGLFSTQFGVRSIQTNFNGNEFTAEDRNQTFMTLGFYRRVDHGLQAGIAIDYLNEQWFSEVDLAQIRGDIGWVYPNSTTLGMRYAVNVNDDVASGVINGVPFNNMVQSTEENYRFYYKRDTDFGGSGEGFVGWSGNNQTVFGMDFDLPIRERVALQSGFTYYLGDQGVPVPNANQVGGNANDTYNIYVGLVFRPRGLAHNRSYDRPLFSVADNGTMLINRN